MAIREFTIDVEELRRFGANMKRGPQYVEEASYQAMQRSALQVQQLAEDNVLDVEAIDLGKLWAGFDRRVQPFEAEIFNEMDYAIVVEKGRTPGSAWPPPGALTDWLIRHGIPAEAEFAIRAKIGIKGIKARPFLGPALEEAEPLIERNFEQAINEVSRRLISDVTAGLFRS